MMNELLPCVEVEPAETPMASVIWLHGLGADGHDFAGIVPQLNLPATAAIRFVFPHAPVKPITINNGYAMRAWYDIAGFDLGSREDSAGVIASQQLIQALIEHEHKRGIAYSRIFLAGFSQGGAMALYCGLRFPERLAGILALSAYLPLATTLATEASAINKDIPIFMAHGTSDTVVPLKLAQISYGLLLQLGYSIDFRCYPMDHSVCMEEVNDIGQWFKKWGRL